MSFSTLILTTSPEISAEAGAASARTAAAQVKIATLMWLPYARTKRCHNTSPLESGLVIRRPWAAPRAER